MTQSSPRDIILHRRSSIFNKRPLVSDIGRGELAINYHEDDTSIYMVDREDNIRKIGGIWYGATPPDPTIVPSGWQSLSHGELWVERVDPPSPGSPQAEDALLHVWNKYINSGAGGWVEIGEFKYALKDDYLDQFKDATDGSDYIHTDRNQLKINNKSALRGYATTIPSDDETDATKANTLVINDQHNFATGVILNANNLTIDSNAIEASSDSIVLNAKTPYSFQTDSATGPVETVFTYAGHGLFNGEEVYVTEFLNDGTTNSGVAQGNYTIAEASLNTFKLFDGSSNVLATAVVKINYSPSLTLDTDYNVIQSGNFKVKGLSEIPDTTQIKDGTWDVYKNTTNGNIRIYARTGNDITQPDSSTISVPVKNSGPSAIPAGTPVYFTGRDPIKNVITVDKAEADDEAKMRAVGVTQTAIPLNSLGDITVFGSLKIDTSALDGATGSDDSGKVVYVKPGGGLTLTSPDFTIDVVQEMGILFQESSTTGEIFINHPETLFGLPNLAENYIWVGDSSNEAFARRLNTDSFQNSTHGGIPEISLADEIKFGAYEFLWDGGSGGETKVQSKVTTTDGVSTVNVVQVIDSFSTSYRSAKFFVQLTQGGVGITPNYQITELLVIHDGTDATVVDYGTATCPGERMGSFDSDILGSDVRLIFKAYDSAEGDIQIKVNRTAVLS